MEKILLIHHNGILSDLWYHLPQLWVSRGHDCGTVLICYPFSPIFHGRTTWKMNPTLNYSEFSQVKAINIPTREDESKWHNKNSRWGSNRMEVEIVEPDGCDEGKAEGKESSTIKYSMNSS
jgi:hypothetical protein